MPASRPCPSAPARPRAHGAADLTASPSRARSSFARSWKSLLLLLVLAHAALGQTATPRDIDPDEGGQEQQLNRELWEARKHRPYEDAEEHVRRAHRRKRRGADDTVVLPTGWKLAPIGLQTPVGRLPYAAVSYAGKIVVLNNGYYTGEQKPEVTVVDPKSGDVVRVLHVDALFPSAAVGGDGNLYVSGGFSQKVYRTDRRFRGWKAFPIHGYAAGLAALDATHLALTTMVASATDDDFKKGKYGEGRLAILNTETGAVEQETAVGYCPTAVRVVRDKLYVLMLGEDAVHVYDRQSKRMAVIKVGRTPQDLLADGDTLYVANSGTDTVSVIDAQRDTVTATFGASSVEARFGRAPCASAADADHLYVTLANTNSVAVFDRRSGRLLGSIPTGWYPTAVLVEGDWLVVVSAKGIRARRPNVDGPQPIAEQGGPGYVLTALHGSVARIRRSEIPRRLKEWTRQAVSAGPEGAFEALGPLPIKYVFYIVRENRTYDQVLGDLPRGNGDSFLTLFGRDVTPNGHRIAEQFVTLDDYYADGEISVLGHSFTTSGYASPFLEWLANTSYSGKYAAYPYGMVPAVTSPAYLWDALRARGVDYRIFGENYYLYTRGYALITEAFGAESEMARKFYAQMMNLASETDRGKRFYALAHTYAEQGETLEGARRLLDDPAFTRPLSEFLVGDASLQTSLPDHPDLKTKLAEYLTHYAFDYRSWDLNFSDLDRAKVWQADFARQLQRNAVPRLQYLWLPNDHTGGVSPLYLPPEQLVAQNDAALGYILETLSASPIWKESLVLVTEDDAQNGADHVDATRTVALAAGPHVRRGAVVSDRYDQLSLLRTIELLLDLPPMHNQDRLAAPMFGIFARQPDFAPYRRIEPALLNDADRERYRALPPSR